MAALKLERVHQILRTHLGAPPSEFVRQYRDKNREFHRVGALTCAMCLAGVDLISGAARRRRVEKPWDDRETGRSAEPKGSKQPTAPSPLDQPVAVVVLLAFSRRFLPFSGRAASSELACPPVKVPLNSGIEKHSIGRRTRGWHVEDVDSRARCSRHCAYRSTSSRSPECATSRPTRS